MSLSRGLRGRARAGPWVVLFAACSTLVVSDVAASVPRAVVGAYMAHMGIGFMGEGLETIRRTNDTADKLLVVVVPLLMACNFLSGLLFGLIVSLIKFVIIYSRAPIVRMHTDGLQSNTVRPWMHRTFLLEYGAANIHIVSVHGFLMFGSSPQLSRAVAAVAEAHSDTTSGATAKVEASSADGLAEGCGGDEAAPPVPVMPPWFVILDLAACKGCDFGAVQELIKLSETVADRGGALRLTLPPAHVQAALESGSRGLLGQSSGACSRRSANARTPSSPRAHPVAFAGGRSQPWFLAAATPRATTRLFCVRGIKTRSSSRTANRRTRRWSQGGDTTSAGRAAGGCPPRGGVAGGESGGLLRLRPRWRARAAALRHKD